MTRRRIVVVGSGLAGAVCALHAARAGCRVVLVTKGALADANTAYAQGGIAAALGADDSPALHLADTIAAGAGGVDPRAAGILVEAGPAAVAELESLGVAFDRDAAGALRGGLEGAHSRPRIRHAGGDATGAVIHAALRDALVRSDVEIREHTTTTGLVVTGGRVRGVTVLVGGRAAEGPQHAGGSEQVHADAVVLATGGAGQLFAHTTNPAVATGDGIALALRAGAAVRDLEFVQFHPTALADGTLVSEAVRGEGAVLRDETGRRFCLDAHPDGELAPRDVVARAIAAAMAAQGGRAVLLDATGLRATPDERAEFLAERFPTIDRAVRDRGWDWAREGVPVTPAAHYLMGGVVTDLDGRTSVPGLYAAGEVARTGVHGANRLASNSLLEAAVFGARAAAAAAADPLGERAAPDLARRAAAPAPRVAPVASSAPAFSRSELQRLMWERVGLERDAAGLAGALDVLDAWDAAATSPIDARGHEDAALLLVARAMTAAALARPGSLGSHHRRDAPSAAESLDPAAGFGAAPAKVA